ncbi:ABC transporter permease [Nocardia asteroides NBRC 15531]|uniref:Transport permease protein n=1 Tax=Nocardia asteroides NBRC 15531 TaxID=1110697 RepID=U5E8R1_NOCAS|nr:ABC transporter permease [Nocardia asteroides]TLF69664.1 ABC transporter permease [Nocardia asteroides NBRC 15531]UGT49168.1 ABC transporter permease [Nocardia asteroides]SFL82407.1 ABC-2 type transport system permease protein [Nocardia asteroides]VEG31039.1 Daunorubicin/doxorubicin resistance ABC transporter permease protein drrB [Nocardia asteroides]GAD83740.1 putative ABC transporter permease protein [Nocardia asteroides NBRC 15531]
MTAVLTAPAATPDVAQVSDRVGLRETISTSFTMAYRGLLKIKHNPEQLFDVTVQPILFTALFTYIFGGAISGSVDNYLPVLIPGILVQTVVLTSVVTGTQLREDMDKGVFDRFKSLPIARVSALAGALLADMVRYGIASTLTIIVGLCLGYRPGGGFAGVVAACLVVVVCSFAISWVWALVGVTGKSAASVQGISMMVMFPLTFMSGAFAPVSTMPGWMQAINHANPVYYMVNTCRDLMNANIYSSDLVWSLLGSLLVIAVFAPLTVRAYMRRA